MQTVLQGGIQQERSTWAGADLHEEVQVGIGLDGGIEVGEEGVVHRPQDALLGEDAHHLVALYHFPLL